VGEPKDQGPEKHIDINECFSETGLTFYRRFTAAWPPPTTDFRWVWAVLFDDPGSEDCYVICHSFTCLFGALKEGEANQVDGVGEPAGKRRQSIRGRCSAEPSPPLKGHP
jgi:hypothetical protein